MPTLWLGGCRFSKILRGALKLVLGASLADKVRVHAHGAGGFPAPAPAAPLQPKLALAGLRLLAAVRLQRRGGQRGGQEDVKRV